MSLDPLFNTLVDRRNRASKWRSMEAYAGISGDDVIPMWIADSEYATASCVREAIHREADYGEYGYFNDYEAYKTAIAWWMKTCHNWEIDTDWILTSGGLGNAVALAMHLWVEPNQPVVTFNPVYHEFELKANRAGRLVTQVPLALVDGRYELDLDRAQEMMTGKERMLIWCSPQNPSGRIWTTEELRAVGDFAERNDLLIITDEIHHDLTYPGETFVPFDVAAPDIQDRLITITASSKTFNLAGQRCGNMIIRNPELREQMKAWMAALNLDANSLGVRMTTAAYSPDGAKWVDAQMQHLDGNRQTFDALINAIPGVTSMPLQSTFLAWVDFAGTGLKGDELWQHVVQKARVIPSHGKGFGPGGETWLRFNIATSRAVVQEAGQRVQSAFAGM